MSYLLICPEENVKVNILYRSLVQMVLVYLLSVNVNYSIILFLKPAY